MDALPVAVAVAPTKLILVIPVPTDVPAFLISTPLITPVRFAPDPTNEVAVTTPTTVIPDEFTVTAVPTLKLDAVAIPVSDRLLPKIVPV